jgi:hypothetical protein
MTWTVSLLRWKLPLLCNAALLSENRDALKYRYGGPDHQLQCDEALLSENTEMEAATAGMDFLQPEFWAAIGRDLSSPSQPGALARLRWT